MDDNNDIKFICKTCGGIETVPTVLDIVAMEKICADCHRLSIRAVDQKQKKKQIKKIKKEKNEYKRSKQSFANYEHKRKNDILIYGNPKRNEDDKD